MNTARRVALLLSLLPLAAQAQGLGGPFEVTGAWRPGDGRPELHVRIAVPEGHYLYADAVAVKPDGGGAALAPLEKTEPVVRYDPHSGEEREVYPADFEARYAVQPAGVTGLTVTVNYWGCSKEMCFFESSRSLRLGSGGGADAETAGEAAAAPAAAGAPQEDAMGWRDPASAFRIAAAEGGYLGADAFLRFLDRAEAGGAPEPDRLAALIARGGWSIVAAVLLIVLFGLGLNLTPCVLPMIPVNVAIIGAGAAAGSRGRGALLGGVYGLAIALVYGALGVVVVLTGSKFGALNASPLFNAAIAVVFIVLALAMFDVIAIDFSRLQGRIGGGREQRKRGSVPVAFVMGSVAALLAGACVAPVVLSVLLLATNLYATGARSALLLPLLLGVGMGAPWPFLGAGMSFLPKPGRWMQRVKTVFGIVILGFALYYGYLAYSLYRGPAATAPSAAAGEDGWYHDLAAGLRAAQEEGKPVFLDFWASWCKNCEAMERTTFREDEVRARLSSYVRVKVRAEDLNAPDTREKLDAFGVIGLPTYVVLQPAS